MIYRGYKAEPKIDEDDDLIWTILTMGPHSLSWHGATAAEWKQAFREAVDDYLEGCRLRGEPPQAQDHAEPIAA